MTMQQVVENIGLIVNGAITWINAYLGVFYANPIMLFFVIMSVVGLGIGLIRRMIRL